MKIFQNKQILQWLGLLVILFLIVGGYFYFRSEAQTEWNTVQTDKVTNGLVGMWSFDGPDLSGTTAYDRSGQGHNGTLTNAPIPATGQIGQTLDFNGTDQYVSVGNAGSGMKTIAFWVNADDLTSRKVINIDGTDQIELDSSGNILATSFPGTTTIYIDGTATSLLTSGWHHIVITDTTGVSASTLEIGRVSSSYFDGKIDEVRLYDRVLSGEEIVFLRGRTQSYQRGDWYDSSWLYRVKITVDHTKVSADATDFPVYVDLSNLPSEFHSHVNQTDGRDIRVTKADGTTEVPREVVSYTSASDTGELHFKASGTLSSSTDTDFYIYYGNSGASDYGVTDTYGRNNVWNSYAVILHNGAGTNAVGNSYVVTNYGVTVGDISGKVSKATSFDGTSSDYLSISNFPFYFGTDNFTMSFWVSMPTTSNTLYPYIASSSRHDTGRGFSMICPGSGTGWGGVGTISFQSADDTVSPKISVSTISSVRGAGWKHIVVRRDGLVTKMFLNGVSVSQDTASSIANYIGPDGKIASDWDHWAYILMDLDEYRLNKWGAFSDNWITAEYNNQSSNSTWWASIGGEETATESQLIAPVTINASQTNKNTSGLLGMWSFDGPDLSGTTAYDRSGQGNNGTLTGGPVPAIGKVGQGLSFDGTNDHVNAGSNSSLDNLVDKGDFSFSAWIYMNAHTTDSGSTYWRSRIASKRSTTDTDGWFFQIGDDKSLVFYTINAGAGDAGYVSVSNAIPLATWKYVTFVYTNSSKTAKLFLDGIEVSYVTQTPGVNAEHDDSNASLYIGNDNPSSPRLFNGKIDDVRIYNRALSADEVTQLYNLGR